MNELRHIAFHRVLYRPNLLLGGDRDLVAMVLLCCAAIGFTAMNMVALMGCFILWIGSITLARKMAKADPEMRKIYFRQITYENYYPARSSPFCEK